MILDEDQTIQTNPTTQETLRYYIDRWIPDGASARQLYSILVELNNRVASTSGGGSLTDVNTERMISTIVTDFVAPSKCVITYPSNVLEATLLIIFQGTTLIHGVDYLWDNTAKTATMQFDIVPTEYVENSVVFQSTFLKA